MVQYLRTKQRKQENHVLVIDKATEYCRKCLYEKM